MEWSKELKEQVVKRYLDSNPTAENSSEIVAEMVEEIEGCTPNGLRIILAKAVDEEGNKVYISKKSGTAKTEGDKPKTKRINKKDAVEKLVAVITAAELNVDDDIIDKLTGKAAVYFTELLTEIQG